MMSAKELRSKIEELSSKMNSTELTFGTHAKLQCEGKTVAPNLRKTLLQSPTRAEKYVKPLIQNLSVVMFFCKLHLSYVGDFCGFSCFIIIFRSRALAKM